ncbi:DUF1467 family protein [Hansschlegelia quercus]|uniref:DUF1467 family protein n=1 Tax=Hansschlegelia quercus TaxID=2528245 RepID=A0A4Q9GB29_9HYPH|nr:DUF1467 family protein [Hansschlegelia quercus]TBN47044.1 DUF1467 family protein [Hansschlegelia quercus]
MIFSFVSWLAVYFVVWWTTLFVVLPFGVRSQSEAGEITPGTEPGAPTVTRVARIAIITTIVATIVFGVVYVSLTQTMFTLDDIPLFPRFDRVS